MTVFFVSQTAEKGGAELYLLDLLKHSTEPWSALFFKDGPLVADLRKLGKDARLITKSGHVIQVKRNASLLSIVKALTGILQIVRPLSEMIRGADAVVANSQKALFVCSIASWRAGCPMVWILHDILTDPSFRPMIRRAAVFFANRFADRVVANSAATAEAFIASGGRRDLVRICYNGFSESSFADTPPAATQALRNGFNLDGRPIVGIFGRLVPWKGQHIFLKALSHCPDVQGVLVGSAIHGDNTYEESLVDLSRELGVEDRVRFVGFREDVEAVLAGVDIVVHASTSPEPFGRVIVEAMFAKRPVIAAEGGGVSEIIENGVNGLLVPPGDDTALARAISTLVGDTAARARMAEQGYRDARERFSIGRAVGSVVAVLAEVRRAKVSA
ncbi:Glycosyltransferase involved in cell wall bisynthesis [Methylobacterium phyllostachyos]|uniref:Glycosyltransferase involved in cell wall bisynthesis n=1 Tax=Methylobacterium phyllostachyos TaxID=582672 RepID=A0A1H0I5K1_9HYPH|nr:glycosyltransferase family 4 protein [Methylobacterium phyllostachyos]SDO26696.1 Glycosyltransferase involved in cell wall bisynthesis [Methylobacterium phyllostachyos]